jgi:hypothetical protein
MTRSTKILIAALALLAVVAYLVLPSGKEREMSYKIADLHLSLDSASVVKVEIQKPKQSVTLEKVGGVWMLTSPKQYAADAGSVAQLIGSVTRLKAGSLISSNPDKQGMFEVDSSGTRLTLTDRAGKSVSLIIGKGGPSYTEVYFRLADSKDVYVGEGLEGWRINQDVKAWRNRKIFSVAADSIQELVLTDRGKSFTLRHDSTGWRFGKDTIAASIVSSVLSTLANLNASDFVDTLYQPKTQPFTLKVRTTEEATLNFYPIPPDTASYFVQTSRTPQSFILTKWTVKELMKPLETLRK